VRPLSKGEANSRVSLPAVGGFAPSGSPSWFSRIIELIRATLQLKFSGSQSFGKTSDF